MRKTADFFTYLINNPADDWGLEITTVGYYHAAPHTRYPPRGHPKTYAFEWRDGRRLDEFQIIYVPAGTGSLETKVERSDVRAGDLILLHKGDWHRYRPDTGKGWETYWVGFKGPYIEKYVRDQLFTDSTSIARTVGHRGELISLFDQLIDLSKRDGALFKRVALGALLQIVAHASIPPSVESAAPPPATISEKAVAFMRQNLFTEIDFPRLASSFGLSYSRFRSIFKKDTGLAPHQFLLNERVACARRLLRDPSVEIKTIGYKVGFSSPSYFSRLFRRKTGTTPSAARAARD
ncbi:MAG TPA: AraC family transcriptional regulator [Steroidobacteraceae bacterium]|jgi:AraC-like DNA-binding protein|nr:AraC family transcriptional regulator [Steroidobacteraceae bacterium]